MNNATILDSFLHVQKVVSAGTSGTDEPGWSQTGGTVGDNAVTWTDQGQKLWTGTNDYALQAIVVDPSGHVQIATTAGKSASTEPSPWNGSGSTTIDGLIWTDQGQKLWQANFAYVVGAVVVDPAGHVQTVTTAGTSGPGPAPTFSDAGGTTIDNTVTWTDGGGWLPNHPYAVGNTVGDAAQHLQEVTTAGISGPASAPTFSDGGGTTPDNAVVWTDNGTWMASHVY